MISSVGSPCVDSTVAAGFSGIGSGTSVTSGVSVSAGAVGSADSVGCSVSVSSGVVSTSIAPHPPAIADAGSRPATIISASSTENSFLNT